MKSAWRIRPTIPMLLAMAIPLAAQCKPFKCLIDGRTTYQQTACPPNSTDATRPAEAASAVSESAHGSSATTHGAPSSASATGRTRGDMGGESAKPRR